MGIVEVKTTETNHKKNNNIHYWKIEENDERMEVKMKQVTNHIIVKTFVIEVTVPEEKIGTETRDGENST